MIERIVSGGQTGVDRAALDFALAARIPCGGWCPKGRRALDGPIPPRYPLRETASSGYRPRTEYNVRDSDGTLIIGRGPLEGGTAFTVKVAEGLGKPCLIIDADRPPERRQVEDWMRRHRIRTLNVAGPREEGRPGIHDRAVELLRLLLG